MTKEEIKAKVAATIAGQGNQVDIAGTLAEILDAIVDNIPEGTKVLDAEDFENSKIELTEQEYDEYMINVHYIELENAAETQGFLSEHTPLENETTIVNKISEVVETGHIDKIYCSEQYSIENEEVSCGDYIALVTGTDNKLWLVYKYIEH